MKTQTIFVPETGDVHLTWEYPQIYSREPLSSLFIHLSHTRAASSIRIQYDGERDGWAISRDDSPEDQDADQPVLWAEIAFVPAWKENQS